MSATKNIYERLGEIQVDLRAPKEHRNEFGKFNFRKAEDILGAVKGLLQNGESVTISEEPPQVVADRVYIVSVATFRCGDKTVEARAMAREPLTKKGMDESQVTGAATSYARKYALGGLFAIDDSSNDPDIHSHRPEAPRQAVRPPAPTPKAQAQTDQRATDAQRAEIDSLCGQVGWNIEQLKKYIHQLFGTNAPITGAQAERVIANLKKELGVGQ
jgi:hypothetical protein